MAYVFGLSEIEVKGKYTLEDRWVVAVIVTLRLFMYGAFLLSVA